MSSSASPWYAGRFHRRSGSHGSVEVLAAASADGWAAIENPRKLFPKLGKVEMIGISVSTLRVGDWLAFQVVPPARGSSSFKISTFHQMPRFVDLPNLGSVEAARALFSYEGWASVHQAGHWAVRFAEDRILVMDLVRERGGLLRTASTGLLRVPCYAFNSEQLVLEPGIAEPVNLYDLGDLEPLTINDWSPDADYIAHVIRALAGDSYSHLDEIITWLELHRDEGIGLPNATNTGKAFEALRSGELAARLKVDHELMMAYLAAVQTDPAVAETVKNAAAKATEEAAARTAEMTAAMAAKRIAEETAAIANQIVVEEAARDRSNMVNAFRAELKEAHTREVARQNAELEAREESLTKQLEERIEQRRIAMEHELDSQSTAAAHRADAAAKTRNAALEVETAGIWKDCEAAKAERNRLLAELERLAENIATLSEDRRSINDQIERATIAIHQKSDGQAGSSLISLPGPEASGSVVQADELGTRIEGMALLTPRGKALMFQIATFLLAGEIPVLDGSETDDFALVAEALMAGGRLVPFDVDETILTPEDLWTRPGSRTTSPIASAANSARSGNGSFLVQLRGIDRSKARSWYPALAMLARKGLLPRGLMFFATLIDGQSEEAQALPDGTCRILIEGAITAGGALLAPSLLFGPTSSTTQLDPGSWATDLSSAFPVIAEVGADLDIAMSLRVARVAVEAARLKPLDKSMALLAAQDFCKSIRRSTNNK